MLTQPSRKLDVFPNPAPQRDYEIHLECPEFTCLCPLTGQPDFARLLFHYVPHQLCVELKSLKLYLWSFRNEGAFHEAISNQILDDFTRTLSPKKATLDASWFVRGGISTRILCHYEMAPHP